MIYLMWNFLLRLFTLPGSRPTPPGLKSQMPVGQMSVGGATVSGPEHQTDTQGRASLNVWSAQCQGLRRRQHRREHKGHTPNPRTEIKIPGIEPGPPGWKAGTLTTTLRRRMSITYLKLEKCSETSIRKFLNVSLLSVMRTGHFEICKLKLI